MDKEYWRDILGFIVPVVMGMVIMIGVGYLSYAFYQWSFDVAQWSKEDRGGFVLFGFCSGLILGLFFWYLSE